MEDVGVLWTVDVMMVGVGCDLLAFDKTALLVFDNGEDALLEIETVVRAQQ